MPYFFSNLHDLFRGQNLSHTVLSLQGQGPLQPHHIVLHRRRICRRGRIQRSRGGLSFLIPAGKELDKCVMRTGRQFVQNQQPDSPQQRQWAPIDTILPFLISPLCQPCLPRRSCAQNHGEHMLLGQSLCLSIKIIVSNSLGKRALVYRLCILELQQYMTCCIVAHPIRQTCSLRFVPLFALPSEEQYIGFGRLSQEVNLYIYSDLHRRQGQLQRSSENLMGLKANSVLGHQVYCKSCAVSAFYGGCLSHSTCLS